MGIFGAMTTAVAGLQAQSYALENISGNIANSQTTGFKRIDTSFEDLIPDTGSRAQLAGSGRLRAIHLVERLQNGRRYIRKTAQGIDHCNILRNG